MTAISSANEDEIRLREHVHAAQLAHLYKQLRVAMPGILINIVVITLVMINIAPVANVLAWSLFSSIVMVSRLASSYRFRRARPDPAQMNRWRRAFMLGVIASGVAWGSVSFVLFPDGQPVVQFMLMVILVSTAAGAMAFLSAYLPFYYLFLWLVMLPLTIRLFMEGTPQYNTLGAMSVLFTFYLSMFARNINQSFVESVKLRYENLSLVDKLTQQKEAAEKASLAKSKFLAAASHDLRQPLHALSLFSAALSDRKLDPDTKRIAENITASVHALEGLFNALLDISRLDSGALQASIETFAIRGIVNTLDNDYRPEAEAKGLKLTLDCPPDLLVRSDRALLERVLRNLLKNAIRYTSDGEVVLKCHVHDGHVTVEVSDSGPGIPAERQSDIFEEFVQLDNPERDRRKGLGLGLAIVKRIAELLEMDLRVESSPGKGSVFSVSVPIGSTADLHRPGRQRKGVVDVDISGLRLLVIDDEADNLKAIDLLLSGWGCETILATSVEDAIDRLREEGGAVDGILADYRLRDDRTGIEAIHAVHEYLGHKVPAMLVTGDTGVDRIQAADASGYRLVYKPVKPAQLRAFLKHLAMQPQQA